MRPSDESRDKPLALVVDDERLMRTLTRETLENAGFSVLEAENGPQAIDLLRQVRPDLVLLDVVMPEMDGFAVCTALRRLPGAEFLPVLMMTALDDGDSINLAYDAGATDFVAKPINWTALGHHVRYLLRASRVFLELKRSEAELARERNFVSAVLETAGALVAVFDPQGAIVRFNRACEETTGYGFAEIRKKSFWEILPAPEELATVRKMWARLLAENRPCHYETHWLTKDGRRRLIAWSHAVLPGEDGQVEYIIATGIDITDRKRAEEQIVRLNYYDPLTDLPNRYLFEDRLGQALVHARRHERPVAALFLDLDRFKRINETLGHGAGDQLLRMVAERLRQCVRQEDTVARPGPEETPVTVARLGGDEFSILLSDLARAQDAAKVARRIFGAFSRPVTLGSGQEVFVTASIGISIYPHDGREAESLLKNAEVAMYHAKGQGRNNYQFYTQSMNASAFEHLALESDLRRALERQEFVTYYQPLVDLQNGRVVGMEALIRWQHPERGLLPPSHFLPLARETGLIPALVEWTLRTACAQGAAWRKAGLGPVRMAVNMPSRQFMQHDLQDFVGTILAETGHDPRFLELEITEETVMQNEEQSIATLGALKKMGIHIAIDDFGTGYSSLSYLHRFPVNSLKIDRSFLREVPGDQDNVSIVRAIIAMAHSLKLKVLAEGVETEEQRTFLRAAGCDEMQGYLFCRPAPAAQVARLLETEGKRSKDAPTAWPTQP